MILCLVMLLSLVATTKIFAQDGGGQNGGGQRQQAMKSFLKDSLNLSDAMVDSVVSIRRQFQPQMREIYSDQSASSTDRQTKLQGLRSAMEARYKTVGITDDQIQKMRDHEDRMMAQMRSRMNNGNQ